MNDMEKDLKQHEPLKKLSTGLASEKEYLTVQVNGINRTLSDIQAAQAAGLNICGDIKYAAHLPQAEGDSETITFIRINKIMPTFEADALVAKVGKYASFKGICKHNQDNPEFASTTPHFTQGKDGANCNCYAAFFGGDDERFVEVGRNGIGWNNYWFVAVVLDSPEDLDT